MLNILYSVHLIHCFYKNASQCAAQKHCLTDSIHDGKNIMNMYV